ncbi:uncharacterized protein LOC118437614 [Folsomia candida]|uniref:uncharacterized protein LOC118437614 n=1 Tax=Folsomia candida TaxID=158441 RepID=UPI001604EBA6|nr:uncharacterized protein LOC118437614 [Folsomia candida]
MNRDYGDDVCPYATFQLPENPPTRPFLTKGLGGSGGFHTGDTLHNVGNVYSGPYHPVQSQNSMATLSFQDAEHLKSGRLSSKVGEDAEDAEVTKILAMHMPPLEYDAIGANDGEISPKYLHPHNQYLSHQNDYVSQQQRQQIILQQQQYQEQQFGTFRRRNRQDHVPTSEELESSSSSLDEESSPTTGRTSGRATYCAGRARHHKSGYKSTSGSSNSGGGGGGQIIPRVRSSSGYSSHTEETSFTTREQPPPKFSKNVEDQPFHGNDDVPEVNGFPMKRNPGKQEKQRQSRSKNKGDFHIDV